MISIEEIEKSIIELEQRDTTFAVCEKLADLYICRDHLRDLKAENARTGTYTGSEFCECCSDVPFDALIDILSEHFDCVRVLYPKEYYAILSRVKQLNSRG